LGHAQYIRDRLTKTGRFQVLNETQRIPVVALTLDKSVTRYNEFDISNKVRERGWILAAYSMPPDAQEVNSLRITVKSLRSWPTISNVPATSLKNTVATRHRRSSTTFTNHRQPSAEATTSVCQKAVPAFRRRRSMLEETLDTRRRKTMSSSDSDEVALPRPTKGLWKARPAFARSSPCRQKRVRPLKTLGREHAKDE